MAIISRILKKIKSLFLRKGESEPLLKTIYQTEDFVKEEIHSIWDYLKFNEHSQAAHITAVVGFEEWVSMEEILRRIKEVFGIEYKNDRSLYPYIKTLVDCGLLETMSAGGKKKWRKRDLIIKIERTAKKEKAIEEAVSREKKGTADKG